jgi:hypothetical protein
MEVLLGAKKAFFEAMMDGYAGGNCKKSIKTKTPDGHVVIEFTTGDYKVVDDYRTTPHSSKSAGTTTILYKNDPIWWMCYGGFYKKEVISFLKSALRRAYEKNEFSGGRGPRVWSDDDFIYSNETPRTTNFEWFSGREEIADHHSDEILGMHDYWGMSLL